jgi:uncharacterized protein
VGGKCRDYSHLPRYCNGPESLGPITFSRNKAATNLQQPIAGLIERIARALERLAPLQAREADFELAQAFVWQADPEGFLPVPEVNRVPLSLLKGIDRIRDVLLANTLRFARGLPATNALLWGARGMAKSSLVKAVHGELSQQ